MKLIKGKIKSPKKVVIYGPEGIGKSTFASKFPDPVFIDTEGSTKAMDVARVEPPTSWSDIIEYVKTIAATPDVCKTIVIDTADWAELYCIKAVCKEQKKDSIESFGYGKGYTYLQDKFKELLDALDNCIKNGMNVVITAHAKMRKFEQPDEMGAYDRWEMKLTRQVAPMVKEWADMVLFANYKTEVINVDGQGTTKGKNKARGGKRVLYTSHHPCWDAKNRYGLAEELPFEFESIKEVISGEAQKPAKAPVINDGFSPVDVLPDDVDILAVPDNLRKLMAENKVSSDEIRTVVAARGYYEENVPISQYDPEFINGVLVGAWDSVFGMIKEMRETGGVRFN